MLGGVGVRLLDKESPASSLRPDERLGDPWHGAQGPRLLCMACGHAITSSGWARPVQGEHEHSFVNPHGFLFRIGCFQRAPGCAPQGAEVAEYSWFPGYTWQMAQCGGCSVHVGWRFRGGDDGFHGLVLDRLIQEAGNAEGEAEG